MPNSSFLENTDSLQNLPFEIDPSKNFSPRTEPIEGIVFHYTAESDEESLQILKGETKAEVSAHFLILRDEALVKRLVPLEEKAWHAGKGSWKEHHNKNGEQTSLLNPVTLGIEISCPAFNEQREIRAEGSVKTETVEVIRVEKYLDHQLNNLLKILTYIMSECRDNQGKSYIQPDWLLGHSCLAPERKDDPGPLFPWKWLYEQGFGAWYEDTEIDKYIELIDAQSAKPDITWIQRHLRAFGYTSCQETDQLDARTKNCLKAFSMRFYPEKMPGRISPLEDTTECVFTAANAVNSDFFNQSLNTLLEDSKFYAILHSLNVRYLSEATLKQYSITSLEDYYEQKAYGLKQRF